MVNGDHATSLRQQLKEAQRQLFNPDFCHIETRRGQLWRHKSAEQSGLSAQPYPFSGKPIRFTRLAANRIAAQMKAEGVVVRIREIED